MSNLINAINNNDFNALAGAASGALLSAGAIALPLVVIALV